MRIFDKFPEDKVCPICNTSKQGKCILAAIVGRGEGYNYEAEIFHLDCVELWWDSELKILYQKIKK